MKYCVIILDGASGWPHEALDGRTALSTARTPHLDALCRDGMVGLAQTVPLGEEPSSSAACMSILGYDPVADYVGRGAIEAAAMGIELAAGDIALRLNLVTIADGLMESYAAGHVTTEESRAIVGELSAGLGDETFRFYPGIAYRHILVASGLAGLLEATYTPPHDISGQPVEGRMPSGAGSGTLLDLMERARPVLERSEVNRARSQRGALPATDVWPFWPGERPQGLEAFSDKRGLTAALSSGVDLLHGLAELTGIDRLDLPGVTDGPGNDYAAQAIGTLRALGDHDVVIVHVESPDEAGHAGDAEAKVAAIEAIDAEVVSRARDWEGELRILAMPDHPTPLEIRTHVGEPVPFVLAGPGVVARGSRGFDEAGAASTDLLVDPGYGVMDLLLA